MHPVGLRTVILVADAYTVLTVLAVIAACITRPHVVSAEEVRIRYGVFFDLRVPRAQIAQVRHIRNFNENGMVKVEDDRLAVVVASQTNLILELTEPITAVRPLGRRRDPHDPLLRRRSQGRCPRAAAPRRTRVQRMKTSTGRVTFAPEPIMRPAARILLIDDQDRILLFPGQGPRKNPKVDWLTPGGGVHRGEDLTVAGHHVVSFDLELRLRRITRWPSPFHVATPLDQVKPVHHSRGR